MTRKHLLHERQAVLWLALAIVILVFSLSPNVLNAVGHFLGVEYPPTLMLVLGLLVVLLLTLSNAVRVYTLETNLKRLTQEVALLRKALYDRNAHQEQRGENFR